MSQSRESHYRFLRCVTGASFLQPPHWDGMFRPKPLGSPRTDLQTPDPGSWQARPQVATFADSSVNGAAGAGRNGRVGCPVFLLPLKPGPLQPLGLGSGSLLRGAPLITREVRTPRVSSIRAPRGPGPQHPAAPRPWTEGRLACPGPAGPASRTTQDVLCWTGTKGGAAAASFPLLPRSGISDRVRKVRASTTRPHRTRKHSPPCPL